MEFMRDLCLGATSQGLVCFLKEVMVLQYGPVIVIWLDGLGLICLNVGFSRYVGGQLLLL